MVFISLGCIIDEFGLYTMLDDITGYGYIRQATNKEIKSALESFTPIEYIFSFNLQNAKTYIKEHNENEILPIKFGKYKINEELIKVIS